MTLEINGRKVEAQHGDTVLAALRRAGIQIPTLCHFEGLPPSGACRMCVVEVEGQRDLVPSCAFPGGRRHEGADPLRRAPCDARTHDRRAAARQPPGRLPLLRPQRRLPAAGPRRGARRPPAGTTSAAERRRAWTCPARRSSATRRSASCAASACACARRCRASAAIDFIGRGSKTRDRHRRSTRASTSRSCINCGQCVVVCPTGALRRARATSTRCCAALSDPEKIVVVQHAPAVSVTPGRGVRPQARAPTSTARWSRPCGGSASTGSSTPRSRPTSRSWRRPPSWRSASPTGGALPMMTSCSPGWIKFVEQFYPDFIPNLSTCKSPQQMLGAVIKTFFAERERHRPGSASSACRSCRAPPRSSRPGGPEMGRDGVPDVDAVLTTRELARAASGCTASTSPRCRPDAADTPFGERTIGGQALRRVRRRDGSRHPHGPLPAHRPGARTS